MLYNKYDHMTYLTAEFVTKYCFLDHICFKHFLLFLGNYGKVLSIYKTLPF